MSDTTSISPHDPIGDPIGCYLVMPPLPTAVTSAPPDTARAMIALQADGVLRRPRLPPETRTHGAWTLRGEVLDAWFSDGFTGWHYQLRATPDRWQGTAVRITDDVTPPVDSAALLPRRARWVRRACP